MRSRASSSRYRSGWSVLTASDRQSANRARLTAVLFSGGCRSLSLLLLLPLIVLADVTHSTNPDNGLQGWRFIDGDIEIELVQRLPDQTRALFMQHAFSSDLVEELARSCMFQTIIRNTGTPGGPPVSVDLGEWRMQHAGNTGSIRLKEPWMASWPEAAADPAARLMFRWGMFPTRQEFLPGDYNWGLTAYGIPPGSMFDLEVSWQQGGSTRTGNITGIECTPDVDALQ